MTEIDVRTAKAQFSKLVARAESGEQIVLMRAGKKVAILVPLMPKKTKRRFGALRGLLKVGPEFFEPIFEENVPDV